MKNSLPLLNHDTSVSSAFPPESVVQAVRSIRNMKPEKIPPICILEFDGDLTDWLVSSGVAKRLECWACFHTNMYAIDLDNINYGIVPRAIGGPYAVLIAEQMRVSGAQVIFGLTSAGRVSVEMPLPGLVVATNAIRDEGTSYHYLAPGETVNAPGELASILENELVSLHLPVVSGKVWTTDAPYRETEKELSDNAKAGVLAVEMQAASLFAFAKAYGFPVGVVAYVTNAVGQTTEPFDKGTFDKEFEILKAICRAGNRFLSGPSP